MALPSADSRWKHPLARLFAFGMGLALSALVISHAIPWLAQSSISHSVQSQQQLLRGLDEYRSRLARFDEALRVVTLIPDRKGAAQRRKEFISDLHEQLEKLIDDAPAESEFASSIVGLGEDLKSNVLASAEKVERMSRSPGDFGARWYREDYLAARERHDRKVSISEEVAQDMVFQSIRSTRRGLVWSASIMGVCLLGVAGIWLRLYTRIPELVFRSPHPLMRAPSEREYSGQDAHSSPDADPSHRSPPDTSHARKNETHGSPEPHPASPENQAAAPDPKTPEDASTETTPPQPALPSTTSASPEEHSSEATPEPGVNAAPAEVHQSSSHASALPSVASASAAAPIAPSPAPNSEDDLGQADIAALLGQAGGEAAAVEVQSPSESPLTPSTSTDTLSSSAPTASPESTVQASVAPPPREVVLTTTLAPEGDSKHQVQSIDLGDGGVLDLEAMMAQNALATSGSSESTVEAPASTPELESSSWVAPVSESVVDALDDVFTTPSSEQETTSEPVAPEISAPSELATSAPSVSAESAEIIVPTDSGTSPLDTEARPADPVDQPVEATEPGIIAELSESVESRLTQSSINAVELGEEDGATVANPERVLVSEVEESSAGTSVSVPALTPLASTTPPSDTSQMRKRAASLTAEEMAKLLAEPVAAAPVAAAPVAAAPVAAAPVAAAPVAAAPVAAAPVAAAPVAAAPVAAAPEAKPRGSANPEIKKLMSRGAAMTAEELAKMIMGGGGATPTLAKPTEKENQKEKAPSKPSGPPRTLTGAELAKLEGSQGTPGVPNKDF